MLFKLNIKKYRIEAGISQAVLAKKSRLTQSYIAKLERPDSNISPTLRSILSISKTLNICPFALVVCNKDCQTCIFLK